MKVEALSQGFKRWNVRDSRIIQFWFSLADRADNNAVSES